MQHQLSATAMAIIRQEEEEEHYTEAVHAPRRCFVMYMYLESVDNNGKGYTQAVDH